MYDVRNFTSVQTKRQASITSLTNEILCNKNTNYFAANMEIIAKNKLLVVKQ